MAALFRIVRTVVGCLLLLMFAALMYPVFTEAQDWRLSFVIVLPAGVVGAAMLRGVMRERKRVARADADAREVAVLRLAQAEGGTLTATQVATRLGWPMETALSTLRAVEDGSHVTSAVTGDGVLVFEFPELIHDVVRRYVSPPPPGAAAATATVARDEASR
jgi:hypothetical protein